MDYNGSKLQTPEKLDLQSTCRGNAVHELERKPKSDIGLIIYFNTSCKKYIQSRSGGRSIKTGEFQGAVPEFAPLCNERQMFTGTFSCCEKAAKQSR